MDGSQPDKVGSFLTGPTISYRALSVLTRSTSGYTGKNRDLENKGFKLCHFSKKTYQFSRNNPSMDAPQPDIVGSFCTRHTDYSRASSLLTRCTISYAGKNRDLENTGVELRHI